MKIFNKKKKVKDEDTKNEDTKDEDIKDEDAKDEDTKGEDVKDKDTKDENTKGEDVKDDDTKKEKKKKVKVKKIKIKKKVQKHIAVTVLFTFIIIFCALFSVNRMNNWLDKDIRMILKDASDKVSLTIKSKIETDISRYDILSEMVGAYDSADDPRLLERMKRYANETENVHVLVSRLDGSTISSSGKIGNIGDTENFRKASVGIHSVSDAVPNLLDTRGEFIFISVPIVRDSTIIGVLSFTQTADTYRAIMKSDELEGKIASYIVKSTGEMVITPTRSEAIFGNTKFQGGSIKNKELQSIPSEMAQGKSGILKYNDKDDDQRKYLLYEPVGVRDWYNISIIPVSAVVAENDVLSAAMSLGLIFIIIIILLSIFYIVLLKHNKKKFATAALYRDAATTLGNVEALDDFITSKKDKAKGYFFVILNINKFKHLNDMLGYETGNNTLKSTSEVLKNSIAESDKAFHINADNFAVLFTPAEKELIAEKVTSIMAELDKMPITDGVREYSYDCTFSCGIYQINGSENSTEEIKNMALIALDVAKQYDKEDYIFFDEEMQKNLKFKTKLLMCVDEAIQERQFRAYFQPKYDVKSSTIIGAEVRARWQHPEMGIINPSDFIPVMEISKHILELDLYMLEEACKMIKKWTDDELMPVPISVNISGRNLQQNAFIQKALEVVKSYGVPVSLIELEIREDVFEEITISMKEVIQQLHNEGFRLTVDKYGSANSSVNVFYDLPIDIVKLDKSFLERGGEIKRKIAVLKYVVQIASELKIEIVCEDVNTTENEGVIKAIGCFHAQGDLYSPVVPVEEFEKLIF